MRPAASSGRAWPSKWRSPERGPPEPRCKQQIKRSDLEGCVQLLGHREVPSLLSNATFLAHTSDNEGCPNAIVEAMACSRAVVATDAGDVPTLIEDGEIGTRRGA